MSAREPTATRGDAAPGIATLLARFLPYLLSQWRRLTAAYLLTFAGVLMSMAVPWPLKYLIDDVLVGGHSLPVLHTLSPEGQVASLALAMIVLGTSTALIQAADKVLHARVREAFGFRLRDDLVQQLYRLNRFSRQAERSGELTMRLVSDTQLVSRVFCKTAPTVLKQLLTAVVTMGLLFAIDARIGVAACVVSLLFVLLVLHFKPLLEGAAGRKRLQEGKVAALTQETVYGIEHVQSMSLERSARGKYLQHVAASLHAGVQEIRVAVGLERAAQIFATFSLAAVAAIGGMAVLSGDMTLGMLTVCLAYVTQLLKPIEKINESASQLSRGVVRARRIENLFNAPVTAEPTGPTVELQRIDSIECIGLGYTYPDSSSATVAEFTHRFRRGECTALVGPSGSGKTTLLRLLLRLLPADRGTLSVDGLPYESVSSISLRSRFAVLQQDAHLFAGSVREIVTELEPEAAEEDVRGVLADVRLLETIDALPAGLDTALDEAGARLSGGQRSRLLLARALLSERSVLILDEPFANIDVESRRIILANLRLALPKRITIVVTHEPEWIGIAQHVLSERDWQARPAEPIRAARLA